MITATRALIFSLLLACTLPLIAATPAPFNYPAAIAEARRVWAEDARVLTELLRKLAEAARKAGRTEDNLNEARRGVAKLKRELEQALEEVRAGLFCDGCGRTRSDLLAHGDPFPHPNQHPRPARPEDYERVEKDFANRMDLQQQVIARLEPELADARLALNDAHYRFLVRLPMYHRHLADEQVHRLGKWLDEKTTAETEIKALEQALATKVEKMKALTDPDQARIAAAELDQLRRQLAERLLNARAAEDRARQEERFFRRDELASVNALTHLAEPIPNRFGIDGWFISKTILNTPTPIGYTVNAISSGGPAPTTSELQELLNGTAKTQPAQKPNETKRPSGEKSLNDLLDGK
jgi:septal ring factor EnvC (AmiA/AmiB activator)